MRSPCQVWRVRNPGPFIGLFESLKTGRPAGSGACRAELAGSYSIRQEQSMPEKTRPTCPNCDGVTRRDFLRGLGGAAAAAAGIPLTGGARADAAPAPGASQETLV